MPEGSADEFDGHVAAKGGSGPGVAERVGRYAAGDAQTKGTPAADINVSIDIMKKTVHEGGKTGINTFIIDGTEHTHVGGDGVGTITVVTEFMLIGNEALAGEVGKLDFAAADETGEGPQRIEVKAGSGKAAVFLKLGGTFYCKL